MLLLGAALCAASGAALAAPPPGAVDDARLAHAEREPQNWLTHGGTWSEQRYSRLDQIDSANVAALKPAWSFEFDTTRAQESTPLVVDGVMYVSSAWSKVYALDARTGRQLWFFDPQVAGADGVPACCDVNNRGVAVYQGKVFVGTIDGRLIALDAANGKPVWSEMTVEPHRIYTITGAPRAARGKVFIGNAGADFGGRGYVSAYDAASGRLVWRFYTVPGDPSAQADGAASDEVLARKARPTWFGEWYKYGGGGHVWNALVYDPEFNQLYIGTGNGFPWNQNFRSAGKGDNLFIACVLALDADSGRYKWHYQETPGDSWDFDSIADITLVELTLGGSAHKVLLHAPKNGFLYVIERQNGRLLSATPYVPGITWATHVDLASGRPAIAADAHYKDVPWTGSPGGGGGHNWNPVAFSPQTGLLYFAATEDTTEYRPIARYQYVEGLPSLGIDLFGEHPAAGGGATARTSAQSKSYLLAWNPVSQKPAWRVPGRGGGVLATAGGLVFQGRSRAGLLSELLAYQAADGAVVWDYPVPDAVLAGPISYQVAGEQYVAVSAGASLMNFDAQARVRHYGHVFAFKLHGTATLPPDPALAPPANPPPLHASSAQLTAGEQDYGKYCARCHGFRTESANVVPDLRRSAALTDAQAWSDIVIGGRLSDHGMIGWGRFVKAADAEAIRAYVGEQARALQQRERRERRSF